MISGTTRLFGLLGGPGVVRSRSPAIHNAAFAALGIDAVYVAFCTDDAAAAVRGARALGCAGINVTMPHKEAAFQEAEVWDDATAAIGACNTLVFREGRTIARNTDAPAILDVLGAVVGADAAVLGAGGSARAAVYALRSGGARKVRLLARSPEKVDFAEGLDAEVLPFEPFSLAGTDLIVSCVPPGVKLDLRRAKPGARFLDLVYQEETALLKAARSLEMGIEDGFEVLVRQAARSFEIWFARVPPLDLLRSAARAPEV